MTQPEKIKLAHVVDSLKYGGAENQVVQILNGLDPHRFERILVTFKEVETGLTHALDPEVQCFNMRYRRWGHVQCITKLYRLFRLLKIDVIQAHMFWANLHVAIAAWFAGVPVMITTEHGRNPWKKIIHHSIEKDIISPLATMRVAVSKDIWNIRVKHGVPEGKIIVIPNCVEIPEIKTTSRYKDKLQIGTVGRLAPVKDYETLIMAFKKVREDGFNAELIFVGDGPERSKLEMEVQDLGLKEYVTFTGFQANVNAFLNDFDMFVLSSLREGIPVAMLEAMAMAVPVVATSVGGIPEVIEHNVDGMLVTTRNPEIIANALERLIQDSASRHRIGEAGRNKVIRFFSREAICHQYEKLYIDLLNGA